MRQSYQNRDVLPLTLPWDLWAAEDTLWCQASRFPVTWQWAVVQRDGRAGGGASEQCTWGTPGGVQIGAPDDEWGPGPIPTFCKRAIAIVRKGWRYLGLIRQLEALDRGAGSILQCLHGWGSRDSSTSPGQIEKLEGELGKYYSLQF